jgi:hypothetical protein
VTQLRRKMLEELQRRNYSHRTAKTYVRIVRDFAEHFHQPPDKLGPEQMEAGQVNVLWGVWRRAPTQLCARPSSMNSSSIADFS